MTPSAASDEFAAFEDGSFDTVGGFPPTQQPRIAATNLNSTGGELANSPSANSQLLLMSPERGGRGGAGEGVPSSQDSLGDLSALMGGGRGDIVAPSGGASFVDSADDLLVPAAAASSSPIGGLGDLLGDLTGSNNNGAVSAVAPSSSQRPKKGRSMAETLALSHGHSTSSAPTSTHNMLNNAQQAPGASQAQGKPNKSSIMSLFGQSSQSSLHMDMGMPMGGGMGIGGPPLGGGHHQPMLGGMVPGAGGFAHQHRPQHQPVLGGGGGHGPMLGGMGGPPLGGAGPPVLGMGAPPLGGGPAFGGGPMSMPRTGSSGGQFGVRSNSINSAVCVCNVFRCSCSPYWRLNTFGIPFISSCAF